MKMIELSSTQDNLVIPQTSDKEVKEKRAEWGNRIEFLLSCVGYSVGLGICNSCSKFKFKKQLIEPIMFYFYSFLQETYGDSAICVQRVAVELF